MWRLVSRLHILTNKTHFVTHTNTFVYFQASDSVNSFNLQPSIANGDTLWQFASPNADGQTVLRPNTCGGKDFGPLYCMNSPVDPTCDTNCSIIYPTLQPCNNNSFAWSTGLSEVFPYPTESVLLAADTASNEFFPLGVLDENEPVGLITTKVDFSDLTEIQWQILSVSDVNDVRWSTVSKMIVFLDIEGIQVLMERLKRLK